MINIQNLNITFDKEVIFKDFSLIIHSAEKVAIVGKSGRGKTTLLNLLAGFVPEFTGDVLVKGWPLDSKNINEIRQLIAWLPQETNLTFPKVDDLFWAPFRWISNKKQMPSEQEIQGVFEAFDLSFSLLKKNTKDISGGQKQRIMLASCLLLKKPILLLDEPTSALDDSVKRIVTDYILRQKDITVVVATHDSYWIEQSEKVVRL